MKQMKRYGLLAMTLVLAVCLCACGGGDDAQIRDDVPVSDLSNAVLADISEADSLTQVDANYIQNALKIAPDMYETCDVRVSTYGTNINEFGIFQAADEEAAATLDQAVADYLQMRDDAWMPEYLPEEYPKLENAQHQRVGRYVMYAILSDSERTAAFSSFSDTLQA